MNASRLYASLVGAVALLAACGPEPLAVHGAPDRTLDVAVGQELDVTLQTVGPGEYESPPSISSHALQYLSVVLVSPYVPAGPTQQFRFKAEAPGQAIVVFQHSGNNPTISDTVNVY
jgi:hypothetical protein